MSTTPHYNLKTYDFDQQDKNGRIIDTMNALHGSDPTSNVHIIDSTLKEHQDTLAGHSTQLEALREEMENLPAGQFVPRDEYDAKMASVDQGKADYHKTPSELECAAWTPAGLLRIHNVFAVDYPGNEDVLLYSAQDDPDESGDLEILYHPQQGVVGLFGASIPVSPDVEPIEIPLNQTPVYVADGQTLVVGGRELHGHGMVHTQNNYGLWIDCYSVEDKSSQYSIGVYNDSHGDSGGITTLHSTGEGHWMFVLRLDRTPLGMDLPFSGDTFNVLASIADGDAAPWTWDDWEHDQETLNQAPPEPERRSLMGVYDELHSAQRTQQSRLESLESALEARIGDVERLLDQINGETV